VIRKRRCLKIRKKRKKKKKEQRLGWCREKEKEAKKLQRRIKK